MIVIATYWLDEHLGVEDSTVDQNQLEKRRLDYQWHHLRLASRLLHYRFLLRPDILLAANQL